MTVGVIQSLGGLNRTKRAGKRSTLLSIWPGTSIFSFLGLQLWPGLTPSAPCFSGTEADCSYTISFSKSPDGRSWDSSTCSCEPILYNKDLSIYLSIYTPLVLSLPRTQNTLEPESLRSYLGSTTSHPYKLKQLLNPSGPQFPHKMRQQHLLWC